MREGVKSIFHHFGSVPNSQVGPDPHNNNYHYKPLPKSVAHYGNHNNDIQDYLDLMIHWHVVTEKPQQQSNNHECNDE